MHTRAGTFAVKAGLAQMLKGGIIMDVVSAEQARIAEEAGVSPAMCMYVCSGWMGGSCDSSTPALTEHEMHPGHIRIHTRV